MRRIFGFDLGTTSVGLAVVDYDEGRCQGRIVWMGSRIFPEGVEPVGGGKNTAPRNQKRRAARLVRRQFRRRKVKRRELGALLSEAGLLPPFGTEEWHRVMNAKKGMTPEERENTDPYHLRAQGLNKVLEPYQIGRALYHLPKRRGFKARSEEEMGEESEEARKQRGKDEGVVKEGIKSLREQMAGRTLGAFLAEIPDHERKRGRHLGRDMLEAEFATLWDAQARFHPDLLTGDLRDRARQVMFHQRPTFWRLKTLGKCRLEPDSPLCPKGSWIGQRFLMLQRLNNLRLAGGNARRLDDGERAVVLSLLEGQASATFGAIRKALKPLWKERDLPLGSKFNFEVAAFGPKKDKKEVPGNATEAALRSIFGERWDELPGRDRIRDEIAQRLREINYRRIGKKRIEIRSEPHAAAQRKEFVAEAQTKYGITEEEAAGLAEVRLPAGWLRHSEAAIERLLPAMERGRAYGELINDEEWVAEIFPNRAAPGRARRDRLPSHPSEMPDLRNPTVARALTELRKVVNNLLAVTGKPDLIRIELARDLKLSPRRKAELDKRQNEQAQKRKDACKQLSEKPSFKNPSERDVEKWLLWQECKETCPYTGRTINFDALFRTGEFQVEHIFPCPSRSLDRGFANKTLCEAEFNNKIKGKKTPFECFRDDPVKWDEVKARLKSIRFPEGKIRRFLKEDLEEAGTDAFAERQLADTAYIAREARAFLARLGVPVEPCNGRVTAPLCRFWSLYTILDPATGKKNRDDHRHHAVDALAVALASPAFVKRLSDYSGREQKAEKRRFRPPWRTLRAEAEEAVANIVVSHRRQRKVSGPLHAATALGDTEKDVVEGGVTYRLFVKRKPLAELSGSEIDDIRDKTIRELVKKRLDIKDDASVIAKKINKDAINDAVTKELRLRSRKPRKPGRIVRKVRILVKRQKESMVPLRPEPKTYAEPGENHHMAIFRMEDGKVRHEIVSRFEATRRLAAGEPVVRRISPNGGRFVMSLAPGDMLEFPKEGGTPDYRVVTSVWAAGPIVLQHHTEAGDKVWKRPNPASLLRMGARKVVVDPIGRIRPAND